jgi:hypothetical protein
MPSGGIVADGPDAVGVLADSGTLRNAISGGLPPASITGPVQVTASNVVHPGRVRHRDQRERGQRWRHSKHPVRRIHHGRLAGYSLYSSRHLPPSRQTPCFRHARRQHQPISGLPAAGILLSANSGGTATLTNDGSIGALSDLAIVGDPEGYLKKAGKKL